MSSTRRCATLRASSARSDRPPGGTVICRSPSCDLRWWAWVGDRANATLGDLADPTQRVGESHLWLRDDLHPENWPAVATSLADHLVLPEVDDRALHGLKFSTALPRHLAEATLSERLADLEHAALALIEPHRFTTFM